MNYSKLEVLSEKAIVNIWEDGNSWKTYAKVWGFDGNPVIAECYSDIYKNGKFLKRCYYNREKDFSIETLNA